MFTIFIYSLVNLFTSSLVNLFTSKPGGGDPPQTSYLADCRSQSWRLWGPKSVPKIPKTAQRRPKTAPRRSQDGLRATQDAPRPLQDGQTLLFFLLISDLQKTLKNLRKTNVFGLPDWHNIAPRGPQDHPRSLKIAPRWPQEAPRDTAGRPKRHQDRPKIAHRGHKITPRSPHDALRALQEAQGRPKRDQ